MSSEDTKAGKRICPHCGSLAIRHSEIHVVCQGPSDCNFSGHEDEFLFGIYDTPETEIEGDHRKDFMKAMEFYAEEHQRFKNKYCKDCIVREEAYYANCSHFHKEDPVPIFTSEGSVKVRPGSICCDLIEETEPHRTTLCLHL